MGGEATLRSPSLRLQLSVIKRLIVASWESVLNISSGVLIIWGWVGRDYNHLLDGYILQLFLVPPPLQGFTLTNVPTISLTHLCLCPKRIEFLCNLTALCDIDTTSTLVN